MSQFSADLIKSAKEALGAGSQELGKAITNATGLVAYDLQAPSKNLYPVITPIRNSIPRVSGDGGTATNWKSVTSIVGSGFDAMGWVPEGQRSGVMSYVTEDKAATYKTLGEEDSITLEAESAAEGFEDINATATMRVLQKLMQKEEFALLGGNNTVDLGTPATPTLSAAGSGATLPALTYSVIVVALTPEGFRNASLAGGIGTQQTINGADGQTFVLNGGSSVKSAAASQAVTLGQTLSCSTTAVAGAAAYAWYTGASGSETLQAITTINSVTFSAPLAAGRQAASAVGAADYSKNANAFNGLLMSAFAAGSLAYRRTLATGVAGTGTPLTASGRGSVNEIDDMLQTMWDTYRISPTVLYVSAQELKNVTSKVLTGASSAPLLRFTSENSPNGGAEYNITANGMISYYFNPFTPEGGRKIPVKVHPNIANGTVLAYTEQLPAWYQSNNVPNVAEVKLQRDYYRMDWPMRTRKREFGVYAQEVLAVYATFGIGVISNIGNG